ncbi:MAG: hypothetical protein ACO1N7_13270 [Sphingobacteriaceae bacterium]
MLKYLITVFFALNTAMVIAQTTDKVSQLISAENYFSALAKEKGIKKAFSSVSDDNTIIFKNGPIHPVKYYKSHPDSGLLNWEPVFARISKSGDWGFTSGPYTYKDSSNSKTTHYGDYLSIWKKNHKGVWKLALDLGVPHQKPKNNPDLIFQNPKNEIFLKQRSDERLQQREDVIFSSDKLMGTILKADDIIALKEFVAEESRLLFPGFEPIIGKKSIMDFWKKQGFNLSSEPLKADRSYSGELAYTYGNATIVQKGKSKKYNYVRIWEVQQGYVWNIIVEVFTEIKEEALTD